MSVKVGKSKEGLHIFNFLGFRPILYDINFLGVHGKSIRGQDVSEVFNCLSMEKAFVGACV